MKKSTSITVAVLISVVLSPFLSCTIIKTLDQKKAELDNIQYEYHVQNFQDKEHSTPENLKKIRAYSKPGETLTNEKGIDSYLYKGPWNSVETKYTMLKYQDLDQLNRFNWEVTYPGESGFSKLFSSSKNPTDFTRKKLDIIFAKVKKLIDLRYENPYKVKMRALPVC